MLLFYSDKLNFIPEQTILSFSRKVMNVEKLLTQQQSPYKMPVKLELVTVSPTVYYENNVNKKSCTDVAFADKTAAVKGFCYDETEVTLFKVDNRVMIRN